MDGSWEETFRAWSGAAPRVIARAPGRVNLIGEHTDYNDGFVLPAAIDREVHVLARAVEGNKVRMESEAVRDEADFSLDDLHPSSQHSWVNYAVGLADGVRMEGYDLPGMDLLVESNLPVGAGLSSSAAYEMALLRTFEALGSFELAPMQAVKLGQRTEWEFAGVRSGVMDQAIARLGEAGHALLLDCRSLDYQQIPINVDAELIVIHTGVPRELARSAYNERRRECELAVEAMQQVDPSIHSLRDVTPESWERLQEVVPEPSRRRARHVITENVRVLQAAEALKAGDLPRLAELFAASHESLRVDYEVSSHELDALVAIANEVSPLIAARLTGAGFGGSTVNLVPPPLVGELERRVQEEYPRRTGRTPTVYHCWVVGGASARVL